MSLILYKSNISPNIKILCNNIELQKIYCNNTLVWRKVVPGVAKLSGAGAIIHSETVIFPTGGLSFNSQSSTIIRYGNGVKFNASTSFKLRVYSHISGNTVMKVMCNVNVIKNNSIIDTIYKNDNVKKGTYGGEIMDITKTYYANENDVFYLQTIAGPFNGDSGSCQFSNPFVTFTIS